MSQNCSDIARSREQTAYVVLEGQKGTLAYPDASNFIAVTNDATLNQTPEYQDSLEKTGTRDITERFKGAMPAAEGSLSMYMNARAEIGAPPQGDDLLVSLFGSSTALAPPVFTLGVATATDVTIPLASNDPLAPLPPCGVIEAGAELIYFDGISEDGSELTGCVRGYNGTTAAAITAGTAGDYKSLAYVQANCNPSCSLFLRTSHLLQAITGATINEASLTLSNEGAVQWEFGTIQGMRMVLAGTSKVTAAADAGATVISVDLAKAYNIGGWVWNSTVSDNGGGPSAGYKIVAVDDDAGTITLDQAIIAAWPVDSVVEGFLPQDGVRIGEPVKGDTAKVFIDGVQGKLRNSTLTYSNNISYLTDEVGTSFPEDYVEDARAIGVSMNTYFRRQDAVRFREGYEGKFISLRFAFGDNKVIVHLPKVQLSMPTITMEAPTVSLDITGTGLATGRGNNTVYLIIN